MAARFSPNMWDGPPHVPISLTLWRMDHSLQGRTKELRRGEPILFLQHLSELVFLFCFVCFVSAAPERLQVAVAEDGVSSQVKARQFG